jgi:hypothetical protein
VVMSISTVARTAAVGGPPGHSTFYTLWLLLPGIVVVWSAGSIRSPRSKANVLMLIAMLLLLTLSLLSCGGVNKGSTTTTTGNKPILYQITVTGTSPGTAPDAGQSAVVTLVMD